MNERPKVHPNDRIKRDRELAVFRVVEGVVLAGMACSECQEEWPTSKELSMPHQFLVKFHKHSKSEHALNPNAHPIYLYVESKNNSGKLTQNTRYQDSWHSAQDF